MAPPRAERVAALLVALVAALAAPAPAADVALVALAPEAVHPGGLAVLRLAPSAVFLGVTAGGRALPMPEADARSILLGVDLDTPAGDWPFIVDLAVGGRLLRLERTLRILETGYPVQRLTLPRKFTDLGPALLARVAAEKAVVDRLWERSTRRLWDGAFRFPLEGGGLGSGFGLRRLINGEPRAPHSGVDIPAPAGAPVFAANAARVVLVADQFFSGISLVLDHGETLFTMYFHLQQALVQSGQGRGWTRSSCCASPPRTDPAARRGPG
jgi:hypothetical protein